MVPAQVLQGVLGICMKDLCFVSLIFLDLKLKC